ncbi:hypothetical protein BGX23_005745 [Mortierella sp. AD031]|nr:hypothetical protein BGX23_005745 [Mortierella sp. AD031]
MDDIPATDTSLANMSRLQLQAACVKLGLDSTPDNDALRKQLQEHDDYMHSHAHSSTTSTISNTTAPETAQYGVSQQPAEGADVTMEDAPEAAEEPTVMDAKEEPEQEDATNEQQQQEQTDEAKADSGEQHTEEMAVEELFIKQEVMMEEDVQEFSPVQDTLVAVKTEKEETEVVVKQEVVSISSNSNSSSGVEGTVTIKQEEGSLAIKQEKFEVEGSSDGAKAETEEAPIPIAQRRQLWEARTVSSHQRSALPLSKARINNQLANRRAPTTTTTAQVQKRRRATEGEDDMDVTMEDQSSPTPPSGTVRKLIGKFAGSTISAPNSPVGKKRKVDSATTKSSPGPGNSSGSTFPSIPKFKRVVKIPVAGNRAGSSLYAMGGSSASRAGAGATGVRRKAASDSHGGSSATAADKTLPGSTPSTSTTTGATSTATKKVGSSKPVSAETINRLATPKKINAPAAMTAATSNVTPVAAPNFNLSASTSTAPSTSTVTRARGPVLSTAARAAQRREKK